MDYEVLHRELLEIVKLKSDPVGIKLFKDERRDLPYINKNLALCQVIKLASIYDRSVGINADNIDACVIGNYIVGFRDLPEDYQKRWITMRKMKEEVVKNLFTYMHKVPIGAYKSGIIAPLRRFKELGMDPDVVLFFGNSTHIYLLLAGYFDSTGNKPQSDFNGHAACEVVAAVINGRSPWLTIPCGGARGLAEAQDDEIWLGMTVDHLSKTISRLKDVGARYPPKVYEILMMTPIPEHSLTQLIRR